MRTIAKILRKIFIIMYVPFAIAAVVVVLSDFPIEFKMVAGILLIVSTVVFSKLILDLLTLMKKDGIL